MLFGIEAVQDIGRFVQYCGSCEGDHHEREHGSQRKSKDRTCDDESQCGKSADREDRTKERKIRPRYEHRHSDAEEQSKRDNARLEQHGRVARNTGGDQYQRNENDRFSDDKDTETGVLFTLARTMR